MSVSGQPSSEDPYPDYMAIREAMDPRIVDPQSVVQIPSALVRAVYRLLGPSYSIAVAALLLAEPGVEILATGEDVGLPIALLAKLTGRRLRLHIICHNVASRRPAFMLGQMKLWSSVRQFYCLARAQARWMATHYGVPTERLRLLYWHVDHEFFQPDPTAPARRQICSAGMASRDYSTLVAATSGLDVDVKIAADSPWFQKRPDIDGQPLPDRVEVRSYGTYAALRRLYAESLFVVVPLYDVPYSAGYTVILEAMAMGKAVIASRIVQCDDFVEDGVTGFHVPPGDVAALRERISFLLSHPEEARRLGANGRRAVEAHFTLAHLVERLGLSGDPVGADSPD